MKKQVTTKSIHIEWRKPENALERQAYGATYADNRIAKIFIDINATPYEQIDTFFHEMAHVFFAFTRNNVPMSVQEKLAEKIGKLCTEALQ